MDWLRTASTPFIGRATAPCGWDTERWRKPIQEVDVHNLRYDERAAIEYRGLDPRYRRRNDLVRDAKWAGRTVARWVANLHRQGWSAVQRCQHPLRGFCRQSVDWNRERARGSSSRPTSCHARRSFGSARCHPGICRGPCRFPVGNTADRMLRVNREALLHGALGDSQVREYGVADGLLGLESAKRHRTVVADSRGRIWFASIRGLSMADPGRADGRALPALTHVEELSADGALLDLRERLRLPLSPPHAIGYAGLSLAVPERVRYRYRLDGFDSDWNAPVTERQAVYTNLSPGEYRFRVTASNGDGLWNGVKATLPLRSARLLADGVVSTVRGPAEWRGGVGPLPPARSSGGATAQRAVRGAPRGTDPHCAGTARYAAARLCQRVHAASRGGRSTAGGLSGQVISQQSHRPDGTGHRGGSQRRSRASLLRSLRPMIWNRPSQGFGRSSRLNKRSRIALLSKAGAGRSSRSSVTRCIGLVAKAWSTPSATLLRRASKSNSSYGPRELRLFVRDDGRGVDPRVLRAGTDGHWGITGMRERAERIGGTLKMQEPRGHRHGGRVESARPCRL